MRLRDVEYFAAIAQHRHLGRAAEAVGLGQPALSMSLRRLEHALGTKLFTRTPKGVELTSTGALLLARVRRLQLVEQDVSREIADLQRGQAGHLRIGVSPGLPEELAGIAAGRLRAEAPRVTFDAMTAATERLAESVSAGELDFALCAIAARPPSELVQELLMEDEFVVYASRTHVLAQRKRLRLTDLSSESWAKSVATQFPWNALENAFERQGLKPPHVAVVSDSTSLRLHAVAASNFLGLISKPFLLRAAPHLDLTKLHLHDARWPRRIGAIYRSQSYVSPAAQRFIHLAKSAARDLAAE